MKKVSLEAQPGQGSDLSTVPAALAPLQAASTLLRDQGAPALQVPPYMPLEPRAGGSWEEAVLRSLSRRAVRTVRRLIQGAPYHALWVIGFNEACDMVGLQRLVPGKESQPCASLLTVISSAGAMGARAIVLVQNRPGRLRLSVPVDMTLTVKLAAAAHLFGITLVDHLLLFNGGRAPLSLRQRHSFPEARALAAHLETALEALATEQQLVIGVIAPAPEATEAAEAAEATELPEPPEAA